jgi:LasA protease
LEPSTDSPVVAEFVDGEVVLITCTTRGESVSSPLTGRSSDLWNYTTLGGFIPDVVVDTGTDMPVKPECAG